MALGPRVSTPDDTPTKLGQVHRGSENSESEESTVADRNNQDARTSARTARRLAALLAGVGVLHFVVPAQFDSVIPKQLPGKPRDYTIWSGVAELAVAAALLLPGTRKLGARLAEWLFIAVYPANVQMAVDWVRDEQMPPPMKAVAVARLPLQIPMVLAARKVRRTTP